MSPDTPRRVTASSQPPEASLGPADTLTFFPPGTAAESRAAEKGFRFGARGTHSSRTIMLQELADVLAAVGVGGTREDFVRVVVDENCLRKATVATRRLSLQRMSELYGLDPRTPLFRALRTLWPLETSAQPMLALLASLARDPLLRASAAPVVSLSPGAEFRRDAVRDALRRCVGERMNDAVLEKVIRNVASSWAQAGLLKGRTFKLRERVVPAPTAFCFAVYLADAAGLRGSDVLRSGWVRVLDCSEVAARRMAVEGKRLGLLNFVTVGDAVEFDFPGLYASVGKE